MIRRLVTSLVDLPIMKTYFARLLVFSLFCLSFQVEILSQESKPDGGTKENVPRAGANGVGFPACAYCPHPDYTKKAREDKLEGSVLLDAIVTVEGKATDIRLLKSLGDGLDEEAIEAVKSWKFKPAKDSARKPIAVRVPIEVRFRLSM